MVVHRFGVDDARWVVDDAGVSRVVVNRFFPVFPGVSSTGRETSPMLRMSPMYISISDKKTKKGTHDNQPAGRVGAFVTGK